jgi:hypothetical protein
MVQPDRPHDNKIRRMRSAYWIPNTTGTLSEYVIRIVFPRQQRLRERASMLRYMHNDCRVPFTLLNVWIQ